MKALAGVMLIIICAMIPSSIILPQKDLSLSFVELGTTWQIQGLFIPSLLCGPQIGMICATTYLILGLFYLPVFHGGGSIGYILVPEFGYLLGFIPAAWTCGKLASIFFKSNLVNYSICTILSLFILHIFGVGYLILTEAFNNWNNNLFELILINTIIPLPSHLLLCLSTSLIGLLLKHILIIK